MYEIGPAKALTTPTPPYPQDEPGMRSTDLADVPLLEEGNFAKIVSSSECQCRPSILTLSLFRSRR
jgi:hypothetical protein